MSKNEIKQKLIITPHHTTLQIMGAAADLVAITHFTNIYFCKLTRKCDITVNGNGNGIAFVKRIFIQIYKSFSAEACCSFFDYQFKLWSIFP